MRLAIVGVGDYGSRFAAWLILQKRRVPMTKQTSKSTSTVSRLALASVCFLWLAGCTGGVALGPDAVKGKTPDGTIEMHEVQAAYIGSGSGGAGSLSFRGVQYAFDVGGVGVGGIGLSTCLLYTSPSPRDS